MKKMKPKYIKAIFSSFSTTKNFEPNQIQMLPKFTNIVKIPKIVLQVTLQGHFTPKPDPYSNI